MLSGGSAALRGRTGRGIMGWDGSANMLGWGPEWREPFRDLLVHPAVVPWLAVGETVILMTPPFYRY